MLLQSGRVKYLVIRVKIVLKHTFTDREKGRNLKTSIITFFLRILTVTTYKKPCGLSPGKRNQKRPNQFKV